MGPRADRQARQAQVQEIRDGARDRVVPLHEREELFRVPGVAADERRARRRETAPERGEPSGVGVRERHALGVGLPEEVVPGRLPHASGPEDEISELSPHRRSSARSVGEVTGVLQADDSQT